AKAIPEFHAFIRKWGAVDLPTVQP
ncbi:MAG: hypothetical protein EZS28_008458, partial [Streblomastix strix]